MKAIRSGRAPLRLLILALVLTAARPAEAEATLRKCGSRVERDRAPAQEVPMVMVDGVIVGDGNSVLSWGRPTSYSPASGVTTFHGTISYSTPSGVVDVPGDQIIYFLAICVQMEMEGTLVPMSTISIGTRAGAEGMMRRYLAELAELQESHRQARGAYAAALEDLELRLTRHPLPIELVVVDGGWSGTATSGEKTCRVVVGSAAALVGGVSGEVECHDTPGRNVPVMAETAGGETRS